MAQSTTGKARDTVERLKPGDRELTPAAKTIAAAAAAAAAGGLAAALKALVEHRSDDNDDEGQRGDAEREEPEADDRRRDEPTATDDAQQEDEDEQEDEAEQDEPQSSRRDDDDNDDDRRQGLEGGAARIVEAGRSELEALLGQQVESVSGFSRSDDGWCVTYEVVEMRRIPDSSDVLSSYAVVLDGDGDLMTLERKHRYRRAQVDEG